MEMPPTVTKTAPALAPFDRPSHHVRRAALPSLKGQNRHPPRVRFLQTKLKVKLLPHRKWRNAPHNGMFRNRRLDLEFAGFNLRIPMVCPGPGLIIEEPADPLEKLFAAPRAGYKNCVMDGDQASPPGHGFLHHLEPTAPEQRMRRLAPVRAVAVENNRVGILKNGLVPRPSLEEKLRFNPS